MARARTRTSDRCGRSDDELATFRRRLNKLGLRLMLDFVPNHSAVDAPWVSEHPELYVHVPKGASQPYDSQRYLPNGIAYGWAGYGPGWMDTVQFNYFNPALVQARIKELLHVASLADGIRCDMAFLLLNKQFQQHWGQNVGSYGYSEPAQEFWSVAIDAVKQQYPQTVFLAEVYDPWQWPLQQLGFDYTCVACAPQKRGLSRARLTAVRRAQLRQKAARQSGGV